MKTEFDKLEISRDLLSSVGLTLEINKDSLRNLYNADVVTFAQVMLSEWHRHYHTKKLTLPSLFSTSRSLLFIDSNTMVILSSDEDSKTIYHLFTNMEHFFVRETTSTRKDIEEMPSAWRKKLAAARLGHVPDSITRYRVFDKQGRMTKSCDYLRKESDKGHRINVYQTMYQEDGTEVSFTKAVYVDDFGSDTINQVSYDNATIDESWSIWMSRNLVSDSKTDPFAVQCAKRGPVPIQAIRDYRMFLEVGPYGAKYSEIYYDKRNGNRVVTHHDDKNSEAPNAYVVKNEKGVILAKRSPGGVFNYTLNEYGVPVHRLSVSINKSEFGECTYMVLEEDGESCGYAVATGKWDEVPEKHSKLTWPKLSEFPIVK